MPRRAFQGETTEDLVGFTPGVGKVRPSNLEANQEAAIRIDEQKQERRDTEASEAFSAYMPAILDGSAPELESLLLRAIGKSRGVGEAVKFSAGLDKFRGEKAMRDAELFKVGAELGLKNKDIQFRYTKDREGKITGAEATNRTQETIVPAPEGSVAGEPSFTNIPRGKQEMTLQDFVTEGGIPGLPRTEAELAKTLTNIEKQSDFFLRNFYSNFPGAKIDETGQVTVGEGQDATAAQQTLDLIRSQIPSFGQKIFLNRVNLINKKTPKAKTGSGNKSDDKLNDLKGAFKSVGPQSRNTNRGVVSDTDLAMLEQMGFGGLARSLKIPDPDPNEEYVSALESLYPGPNARG